MVVVAPLLVFTAFGVEGVARWLAQRGMRVGLALSLIASVAVAGFVAQARWGQVRASGGFARIFDDLDRRFPSGRGGILVSSDEIGDGMFVAKLAERDERPNRYALRASKVLATSRWSGANHRLTFDSPDKVAGWLEKTHVGILLLDNSPAAASPEHRQLQEVVARDPTHWQLVGRYDLVRNGMIVPGCVAAYRQTGLESYVVSDLEINMEEMLGDRIRQH